jgi:hypothetical protein
MLVLDKAGRERVARLREAAEAAPMSQADVRVGLRLRQTGQDFGDPAAYSVSLVEGYLVAFRIEEWPDGRWRRLTISAPQDPLEALAMLQSEFGFVCEAPFPARVAWYGPKVRGRRSFTVAELIEARQEPTAPTLDVVDEPIVDLEEQEVEE